MTEDQIKNDRSSWSKLRIYYALYVDRTKATYFCEEKKKKEEFHVMKDEMFSFVIRRVLSRITEIFRRSTKRSSRVGGTAKTNRWDN